MRIRLFYCGTLAINLLADLTNYLMLEMGQPMHFSTAPRWTASGQTVRRPFWLQTLDGTERRIDENTLMICSKGTPWPWPASWAAWILKLRTTPTACCWNPPISTR